MPPGQALTKTGEGTCLDDETLALLLDAALEPSEDADVRAHIDRCDACRQLFAEAARASSESGLKRPSKRRIITYAPTEPGDIVARKYKVERPIGVGGMGHVFAARHVDLDQLVALKVMRPEMLHDQDAMRRFAREGRAAAALRSEHAVRIIDVGRLEGGTPFIVMEYLEGRDLASILEKGGPLPFAEAIDYVIQACDALEEAHALGIIHRDLKPHNLFVTTGRHGEPFVKVLDFGLAKAITNNSADIAASAMTGTNVMLGSPFFMSPEQVHSTKDIDHRSDIWSLGATLYHLVTGVPPFVAPNVHLVCARILTDDFPPVHRRRRDAPPELETLLRRCMARDPGDRFATVRELVASLKDVRNVVALGGGATTRVNSERPTTSDQATRRSALVPSTQPTASASDSDETLARPPDSAPTLTKAPDSAATLAKPPPTVATPPPWSLHEDGPPSADPGPTGMFTTAPPTVGAPQAAIMTGPVPTVASPPPTVAGTPAILQTPADPIPSVDRISNPSGFRTSVAPMAPIHSAPPMAVAEARTAIVTSRPASSRVVALFAVLALLSVAAAGVALKLRANAAAATDDVRGISAAATPTVAIATPPATTPPATAEPPPSATTASSTPPRADDPVSPKPAGPGRVPQPPTKKPTKAQTSQPQAPQPPKPPNADAYDHP